MQKSASDNVVNRCAARMRNLATPDREIAHVFQDAIVVPRAMRCCHVGKALTLKAKNGGAVSLMRTRLQQRGVETF